MRFLPEGITFQDIVSVFKEYAMTDGDLQRNEKVAAAAKEVGLNVCQLADREWLIQRGKKSLGTMYCLDLGQPGEAGELWVTVPGTRDAHRTPQEALQRLSRLSRTEVLTVAVEYDTEVDLDKGQAAELVAEVVFAFRQRLAQEGVRVKRLVVEAPGVRSEWSGK